MQVCCCCGSTGPLREVKFLDYTSMSCEDAVSCQSRVLALHDAKTLREVFDEEFQPTWNGESELVKDQSRIALLRLMGSKMRSEAGDSKVQLINGFLPPHTACPMDDCLCAATGRHKGKDHPNRFSCALLRGFALTDKGRERVEQVSSDDPAYTL